MRARSAPDCTLIKWPVPYSPDPPQQRLAPRMHEQRALGDAGDELPAQPLLLLCIPDLLREFAVAPESVLRRAAISPGVLADPQNRLSFTSIGRLAEACVVATGRSYFGLLVGQRAGPAAVGIIRDWMRCCRAARSEAASEDSQAGRRRW
jgi:hypothetical protein